MASCLALTSPLDGLRRHGVALRELARRLWRDDQRRAMLSLLLLFVAAVVFAAAGLSLASGQSPQLGLSTPPAPPPLILKNVAPAEALKLNASIPLTAAPTGGAAPFEFTGSTNSRAQALQCLASAVYYEAGSESVNGQRAVAQVVLNRVRHPAFPASVCGVVYQGSTRTTGCQFTFTCDGSLGRAPEAAHWDQAKALAKAALDGSVYAPIGWSTHYHANYVVPYWAASMAKNAVIGAHLFYLWRGAWGDPSIFVSRYSGHEASAAALRSAALTAEEARTAIAPGTTAGTASLAAIPGAQLKLTPSMRGDPRVAVRFNQVARKATETIRHRDYAQSFEASDNLKWALGAGDGASSAQAPLGKPQVHSESGSTGATPD